MTPDISIPEAAVFDGRSIPCSQKHPIIFERWHALKVGEFFVLINGHDPVPLYHQFAALFPGAFNWEYLNEEEGNFHVKISRLAETSRESMPQPPRPKR
ncbi:DUF2249 domain-containing protein [Nibricoccus sp. IMCC34717]|uniref:DUF2249 domain-containing protein n=1 Tax=Nibricoccus sp. IMCC34717 TaxID=3034021 RepID=UPI00384CA949